MRSSSYRLLSISAHQKSVTTNCSVKVTDAGICCFRPSRELGGGDLNEGRASLIPAQKDGYGSALETKPEI